MDVRVSYTLVGAFVISILAFMFLLIAWLSSPKQTDVIFYKIIFKESVIGLEEKSSVLFNGVNVGYVKEINLNNEDLSVVNVIVGIGKKIKVGPRTIATLKSQGITGMTQVSLATNERTNLLALRKDKNGMEVIPTVPSLFFRLDIALQKVFKEIRRLTSSVSLLVNDSNVKKVTEILNNISKTTKQFADKSPAIGELIVSSKNTVENLNTASEKIPHVVDNLNHATEEVTHLFSNLDKKTARELNQTLSTVQQTVKQWDLYLLPKLMQTISNLKLLSSNLGEVSDELVDNPSILIRGKQSIPLGPGER